MNPENYNETVLLPLLNKKIHDLGDALTMAEAKLEIAYRQNAQLQAMLNSAVEQLNAVGAANAVASEPVVAEAVEVKTETEEVAAV